MNNTDKFIFNIVLPLILIALMAGVTVSISMVKSFNARLTALENEKAVILLLAKEIAMSKCDDVDAEMTHWSATIEWEKPSVDISCKTKVAPDAKK